MSDPVPLTIAGLLPSPGVYGRTLSGAGTGKILTAAEIRAAAESYSSAQVDTLVGGRVPYTGANAAVNLGANALTCGAITASGNLAIRNGLTPMLAEIFGTYTSPTSFESLCLKATATAHQIGSTVGTAGGTNRPVHLGHFSSAGAFTAYVQISTAGTVRIDSTTPLDIRTAAGFQSGTITAANGFLNLNAAASGTPVRVIGNAQGLRIGDGTFTNDFKPVGSNSIAGVYAGQGITAASGALAEWRCADLTIVPSTSRTLSTNGQFSIEMTSNTAGNLVYRGSDGTTRRMALLFT
jgi:hypothetical protein